MACSTLTEWTRCIGVALQSLAKRFRKHSDRMPEKRYYIQPYK